MSLNTAITAYQHQDSIIIDLYLNYSGLDNHAVKESPPPPPQKKTTTTTSWKDTRYEVLLQRSRLFAFSPKNNVLSHVYIDRLQQK